MTLCFTQKVTLTLLHTATQCIEEEISRFGFSELCVIFETEKKITETKHS